MVTTPIRSYGIIECPECDAEIRFELDQQQGRLNCPDCGYKGAEWGQESITIEGLLALFGYLLTVDFDGQLLVESEQPLPKKLVNWLFEHQGELRHHFDVYRYRNLATYVGGTMNGHRHGGPSLDANCRHHVHLGRAHWETYEQRGPKYGPIGKRDPRLFFLGRATSEAKARAGEFVAAASDQHG